ncbi:putative tail fiber assembly-like protein [Pseudomonas chlororaphis subsp. aurantiaca]|nr:putative tail fiber assembly-like protein [Pseudomonas chlororaphis subsp. aurantiaca]
MSKQVLYCVTSGTVIDWQDLDQFAYAAPAPTMKVLPVTAEQWKQKDALHFVLDGELTRVDGSPPSAAHYWDGSQWSLDASKAAAIAEQEAEQLCRRVDAEADAARQMLGGDPLRAMEYAQAASDAQAFKEAGYPKKAVPLAVSAWVVKGRTAKAAADQILDKAAELNSKLLALRTLRLQAKERIRALASKGKQEAAKDACEAAIEAIRKVAGN